MERRTLYPTIEFYEHLSRILMYLGCVGSLIGALVVGLSGIKGAFFLGPAVLFGGVVQSIMIGAMGQVAAAISEIARNTRNIRTYNKM